MTARGDAPLRVLQTQRHKRRVTRFERQMTTVVPPGVVQLPFNWPRALAGRYDVVHAHWPEYLARHRVTPARAVKRRVFSTWISRLERNGTPVVRTLHNPRPHSPGDEVEGRLLERFDRLTALRILLNPFTPAPGPLPTVQIPHGHYVDRFAHLPQPPPTPGRLAHVGELKPYKGVDKLVEEFRAHDDDAMSLSIAGRPMAPRIARQLREAAAADPRITVRLQVVSDAVMVEELARAELVVLPYQQMHNSGVVMVALSLGRPILVPDGDVNRWLGDEVGPGWVHRFEPPFEMADVLATLEAIRRDPDRPDPDLEGRDWATVGRLHAEAYWQAVADEVQVS